MRFVGLWVLLVVGCQSETAYLGEGQPNTVGGTSGAPAGGGGDATRGGSSGRGSIGGSARGGSGAKGGGGGVEAESSGDAGDANGGLGANGGQGANGGVGANGARGGTGDTGDAGTSGASGPGDLPCSKGTLQAYPFVTTPSELEAVAGYETIDGDLFITSKVSDLTPLACLKQITGDLTIFFDSWNNETPDTDQLASLAGLDSLSRIDGNVFLGRCSDSEDRCPAPAHLTSLAGLGGLRTIGGMLYLEQTAITDVDGLANLTQAGGLSLSDNGELSSLEGFRRLVELPLGLYLGGNGLTTLDGLENITRVGSLGLYDALPSLEGLRNLVTVPYHVWIANTHLANLHGLEGLSTIGDSLEIGYCYNDFDFDDREYCDGNDQLVDIDALSNLSTIGDLFVSSNPLLVNLDALSHVVAEDPSVSIVDNAALAQIDGLQGLFGTAKDIRIENNPLLDNLDGLAGLTGVNGDFKVVGNDVLREVEGFHGPSGQTIDHVQISDNPSLVRFDALDGAATIYDISFKGNYALTEISGLHVTQARAVTIGHSPALSSVAAFSELTSAELSLSDTGFTNLGGFAALTGSGGLWISANQTLLTLDGLEHLTSAGSVGILLNPLLTNLRGLGNLTAVAYDFAVQNNATLPECEAQWLCGLVPSSACNTEGNAGTGTCQ